MNNQNTAAPVSNTNVATNSPAGTEQLDITISNSLTAALNIELFQALASQTQTFNINVNNYHPIAATAPGNNVYLLANTISQFGVSQGVFDTYATSGQPSANLPTGNTKNAVYWDENGQLNYLAGYVGGVATTGSCTVNCAQSNYRRFFDFSKYSSFVINSLRIRYTIDPQIDQQILHIKNNVMGTTQIKTKYNPRAFYAPTQFQTLLVDIPLNVPINKDYGFQYNMLGGSVGTPNVVTMSVFFTPKYALNN